MNPNNDIARRRWAIGFKKIMKKDKEAKDAERIFAFLKFLGEPTSIFAIRQKLGMSRRKIERLLSSLILQRRVGRFRIHSSRVYYGSLRCAG